MNVETLDQGRLTVAQEFLPLLRANGLDTFATIMALTGGTVARDFPGRRTVRLELPLLDGGSQGLYLKRYETGYLSTWRRLLRRAGWPGAEDEAWREWRMIREVSGAGVLTASPVAVGQERPGRGAERSFLMTAEIPGALEGHTYSEALPAAPRRRFLSRVAEMARRFHAAGFAHKDFYLGHVLVVPDADEPGLFLIDLQRTTRPCCFRRRWITKDLGAMAYSMFNAGASYTDLLRVFMTYTGQKEMSETGKQAARRIMRRVSALRRRQPKHGGPVRQRV